MQHGTVAAFIRFHFFSNDKGGGKCPAEHIRQRRTARPSISNKAMKSAVYRNWKPNAALGRRSTNRTKAAGIPGRAGNPAAAKRPKKVGKHAAATATAKFIQFPRSRISIARSTARSSL